MKLKKLAAAIVAACVAMTSVIVSPIMANAEDLLVADDLVIPSGYSTVSVDLTTEGVPTSDAVITFTVVEEVTEPNGWDNQVLFAGVSQDWSKTYFSYNYPDNGHIASAGTTYTCNYSEFDGATSVWIYATNVDVTLDVSVSAVVADDRAELTAEAYDGSPITMTKSFPDWATGGTAQGEYELTIPGVTYGETTYAELKEDYKKINFAGLSFTSDSIDGSASDYNACLYVKTGADAAGWGGTTSSASFDSALSWNVDSMGLDDTAIIGEIGVQINMVDVNNLPDAVAALEDQETFTINPAAPTTYEITTTSSLANGTVTVKDGLTEAAEGDKIEFTVTPDDGYAIDAVLVNGATDTKLASTSGASKTFTFTMPDGIVTIAPTFRALLSGTYGDGAYTYQEHAYVESTAYSGFYDSFCDTTDMNNCSAKYNVYAQRTNNGDNSVYRFYKLVSEETLADKTGAYINIKNYETGKSFTLTTNKAYRKLTEDEVAPEGYVYIVFVIDGAPELTSFASNKYTSPLSWTNIYWLES